MREPIYTIEIDETNRISAYHETDFYHREEITGEGLNIQPIQHFDRFNREAITSHDEHAENIARLVDSFHYYNHPNNYAELRERAVGLYLSAHNIPHKFVSLIGYSQGERLDVVMYGDTPEDTWVLDPKSHLSLEAWFTGDIYTVCHEKLETYINSDGSKTISEWEIVDSIGACVAEDEDSIREYISYFNLTNTK